MIRELVTKPIRSIVALVELPLSARRSLEEVNQLMERSRRQLEAMERQTDSALVQAERMNEMLGRVVKLTEPIERAQRGGEYVGERLKRAIFGEEEEVIEGAAERAEAAALKAEAAADEAEEAVEGAEEATEDAGGR